MDIINPRTGQADYHIETLDAAALGEQSKRLRKGQLGWAARPMAYRCAILRQFGEAVAARRDAIAKALIADTGRGMISRIEVDGIVRLIDRWVEQADVIVTRASPVRRATAIPGIETTTRLVPYALVGIISPWNFPLTLAFIDAIPALLAGCAVLIKPSEVTPRFIRPVMEAVAAVPELADVLMLVEGDGDTGAALVPLVDYVAFTGSVPTGQKVGEAAARAFIPSSLELGGKDPMIILASADPVSAAEIALRASIVNTGQACQSIERVYVARSIAEPFLDALVASAEAVKLNYPDLNDGHIGPFIFSRQAEIVQAQLDDAVAKGAKLHCGGTVETLGGGRYLRPTVLTDVSSDMTLMSDETFGPVIPVTIFDDVEDAVAMANDSVFGLSGAVVAATLDEAEAIGRRLNVGGVSLNDGSLTSMVWEAEKSSFGLSGLGASRMGDSGILRFFRRQALIRQGGNALPITAFGEAGAPA